MRATAKEHQRAVDCFVFLLTTLCSDVLRYQLLSRQQLQCLGPASRNMDTGTPCLSFQFCSSDLASEGMVDEL